MAYSTYTITLTNGTVLAYVSPQTVDDSSSALTLVGQADLGYGVPLNENFVHLLENFAYGSPPVNTGGALQGQLWFDTTNNLIKLYDTSSTWTPLATQEWVEANFSSGSSSGLYATESWVESYVSAQDFVTETYLTAQGYLTANQTITLSGDITGSGTTNITASLTDNGVIAGTYEKVIVDATGRVTTGNQLDQQDIITALGYTPAAVGNGPGQTQYAYGALGQTAGTVLNYLSFESTDANTNVLQFSQSRFANGTDWTTATTRLQLNTDVNAQGYIDFNPQSHKAGVGIGAGNVVQLVCQNTGTGPTGVYINGTTNIVGGSGLDPSLWFQSGTLNNNNSGFASYNKLGLISFSQVYGVLYLSSNSDGSNNVTILPSGSIGARGVLGGTSGVIIGAGSTNQNTLFLNSSGILALTANNAVTFSVDASGNSLTQGSTTSNGSVYNLNGNWNTNTNGNMNFWVNNAGGTNLGCLWFDNTNSPHAWRMIANSGGGGGPNQLAFDANGALTAVTVNVDNVSGYQTGIANAGYSAQDNLSFYNGGQRRIRIDGLYDFEANQGHGADTIIPGDINFFYGEGNFGDENPTNQNGDRRRFAMQSDGNCVIYTLNDETLWSADTQGSDVRWKENIDTYTGGLEFIKQVRPVTFQWKKGTGIRKAIGDAMQVGFIAQELEEIEGHNAVTKHGRKDSRVVHKQALVPHLVSAAQELATENDILKDKVRKLEEKIRLIEEVLRQRFSRDAK